MERDFNKVISDAIKNIEAEVGADQNKSVLIIASELNKDGMRVYCAAHGAKFVIKESFKQVLLEKDNKFTNILISAIKDLSSEDKVFMAQFWLN